MMLRCSGLTPATRAACMKMGSSLATRAPVRPGRRLLSTGGSDVEAAAKKARMDRAAALAGRAKTTTAAGSKRGQKAGEIGVAEGSDKLTAGQMGVLALTAAVFGLSIVTSHEVKNNPNGAWAQGYRGSVAESMYTFLDENILSRWRSVFQPYSEQVIPKWENGVYYGDYPDGNPPPPLLILDLNQTLMTSVHDAKYGWRHVKRPGLDSFLTALSSPGYYEVCIFSDQMIDPDVRTAIDPRNMYFWVGPDAGEVRDSVVLKRLDVMGRPLQKIVVVDDQEDTSQLCRENTLLIKPFDDAYDSKDTALDDLKVLLQALVHDDVKDYPACFKDLGTNNAADAVTEYKMRLSEYRSADIAKRTKGLGGLLRRKEAVTNQDDPFKEESFLSKMGINVGDTGGDDGREYKGNGGAVLPSLTGTGTTATPADLSGVGAGKITGKGSGSKDDNNLKPKVKKVGPLAQWYADSQKQKMEDEMNKQQYMNEKLNKLYKEKQDEEEAEKKKKREASMYN